jgi:hypothetical protein
MFDEEDDLPPTEADELAQAEVPRPAAEYTDPAAPPRDIVRAALDNGFNPHEVDLDGNDQPEKDE